MKTIPESTNRLAEVAKSLSPSTGILSKLLKALQDEDLAFSRLVTIIESDPILAGNVLHAANSGLYGRSHRLVSVSRAIALLGSARVQNIALALSVLRIWGQKKYPWWWSQQRFSRHCLATATLCDLLAQKVQTQNTEGAFIGGLLHGLGKLAFVVLCPKELAHVYPGLDERVMQKCFEEIQYDVLGCSFEEATAVMVEKWCLPPVVQNALTGPDKLPQGRKTEFSLSEVLVIGHRMVGHLGLSYTMCHEDDASSVESLLNLVNLQGRDRDFLDNFQQAFDTLQGI